MCEKHKNNDTDAILHYLLLKYLEIHTRTETEC